MAGFTERFEEKRLQKGLNAGLEGGREEHGLLQDKQETRRHTARKLIEKTRMDNASIAEVTALPEAEIQTLRSQANQ